MKVLFIAPLPPPMNGQSLASKVFLSGIENYHDVTVVDTTKQKADGLLVKIRRATKIFNILLAIYRSAPQAERIYLTISQSIPGNIKDLLTYVICFRNLDKMLIHLHGGASMVKIMRGKNIILALANAFFLKRIRGVVILGESHRPIFEKVIPPNKIHVVPNFAEDFIFLDKEKIMEKFETRGRLNVLFLSNMLRGKGYMELLEAFFSLPAHLRVNVSLDFAGAFGSEFSKKVFLDKIDGLPDIRYHGVVVGEAKRKLFESAHLFCLPTYYENEGQPISILEAYASGCVVITTNHSGIRDVFTDGVNGYEVEKKSVASIRNTLERVIVKPGILYSIGAVNRMAAEEKFRSSKYIASLAGLLDLEIKKFGLKEKNEANSKKMEGSDS